MARRSWESSRAATSQTRLVPASRTGGRTCSASCPASLSVLRVSASGRTTRRNESAGEFCDGAGCVSSGSPHKGDAKRDAGIVGEAGGIPTPSDEAVGNRGDQQPHRPQELSIFGAHGSYGNTLRKGGQWAILQSMTKPKKQATRKLLGSGPASALASALAKMRWDRATPAEKSAHSKKMNDAKAAKKEKT